MPNIGKLEQMKRASIFFLIYLCLTFLLNEGAYSQGTKFRYLVLFKDKKNNPNSINQPETFLSARSIARRTKMNIKLNEQDLPVNPTYLNQLITQGAQLLYPLKWVNGAVVKMDQVTLKNILTLSFVKGYYKNMALDSLPNQLKNTLNRTLSTDAQPDYGTSSAQINQLGVDAMHKSGFRGENILISLLDDGYLDANKIQALAALYQEKRISATLTTDPTRKSVYESGSHGTAVLGTIAAQVPGKLYGTAYMANFALAQTEESQHELLIEEANWLRGAEWADSLGTDVLNSSLGYTKFDNPIYDHSYQDMNGKTALSTLAAVWASRRGIICTISAGNEGSASWKYISSPADADSILSVGAVDRTGLRASFSSTGPSFDKRIKPDVSAMGLGTVASLSNGNISSLNGTSFSAPLMAGLAAGLVQAHPSKNAWEIMQGIRKSGTLTLNPDNLVGYGIPHFERASKIINPILGNEPQRVENIKIFPNPTSTGQAIQILHQSTSVVNLEIISPQGAVIQTLTNIPPKAEIFLPPFVSGKYYFRFTSIKGIQSIPVILNL
jgi:serine protease AprX